MSKFKSTIILFVLVACFVAQPAKAGDRRSSRYNKSLKTWTRQDEVYQREDFHASLKWHATWLNQDFLAAWAREHAKIYDLDAADEEAFLLDLQNQYGGTDVFFVSFYSYSFRESDLAKRDAVWKLSLETDGQNAQPIKIEKLSKPTSYHKRIFNYIDTWSSCYFVSFAKKQTSEDDLHLKINGPTGKGQLTWKAP